MSVTTGAGLMEALQRVPLLTPAQRTEISRLARQKAWSAIQVIDELVRRAWLTDFQAKKLLQGRGAELKVGPFLLADLIGEGGMGNVYRANHAGLRKAVALKLLKPELVGDAEVVARFYREIKATSRFQPHANVVQVFDAGPIGNTHFLAMELLAGIDLDRLVASTGPLPVARACDYLRQAALGLQHAHEHGLVHRDIKPANLFLASAADPDDKTVKILDLGLARLHRVGAADTNSLAPLTADGTVMMGTIDYLAPEQALDFHRADIRADIYGLGCAGYYLLTGNPPFGSGTLAVKLMRHHQAAPPDLKALRPEVPKELARVFLKMLAKQPGQRYQTPAEVAAAFAPFAEQRRTGATLPASTRRQPGRKTTPARARVFRAGLVAILLVAVLLSAGLWLLPKQPANQATDLARNTSPRPTERKRSPLDALDPSRVKPPAPPGTVAVLSGHRLAERDLKFSPDGRLLATCSDRTSPYPVLWDLTGPEPRLWGVCKGEHKEPVTSLAFSPDSKRLAYSSDDWNSGMIWSWDLTGKQPKLERVLCGTDNKVFAMMFAPDGKTLATSGYDKVVRLWNVLSAGEAKPLSILKGHQMGFTALAFSPDGKRLASGGTGAESTVRLWDLASPKEPIVIKVYTTGVTGVAFAPDGRSLAATTAYGMLVLYDLTGPEPKERFNVIVGHNRGGEHTVGFAFSPDGKTLISASQDGRLDVWDAATGKKLRERKLEAIETIHRMALAPDGRHLAVGAGYNVYIIRLSSPP